MTGSRSSHAKSGVEGSGEGAVPPIDTNAPLQNRDELPGDSIEPGSGFARRGNHGHFQIEAVPFMLATKSPIFLPSGLEVEKFLHLRLHGAIHPDKRRPGAFETFARQFLRRIDAEFAAGGDFAGGLPALSADRQALGKTVFKFGQNVFKARPTWRKKTQSPPNRRNVIRRLRRRVSYLFATARLPSRKFCRTRRANGDRG